MNDPAERRAALERFTCPDHGCDLEEGYDIDEHGPFVTFRCPVGEHYFGSVYDPVGGYAPVEEERWAR